MVREGCFGENRSTCTIESKPNKLIALRLWSKKEQKNQGRLKLENLGTKPTKKEDRKDVKVFKEIIPHAFQVTKGVEDITLCVPNLSCNLL